MMVLRHSSNLFWELCFLALNVIRLNLDKLFLIFVFNLLDTPVFLESWVPVASNTAINGEN